MDPRRRTVPSSSSPPATMAGFLYPAATGSVAVSVDPDVRRPLELPATGSTSRPPASTSYRPPTTVTTSPAPRPRPRRRWGVRPAVGGAGARRDAAIARVNGNAIDLGAEDGPATAEVDAYGRWCPGTQSPTAARPTSHRQLMVGSLVSVDSVEVASDDIWSAASSCHRQRLGGRGSAVGLLARRRLAGKHRCAVAYDSAAMVVLAPAVRTAATASHRAVGNAERPSLVGMFAAPRGHVVRSTARRGGAEVSTAAGTRSGSAARAGRFPRSHVRGEYRSDVPGPANRSDQASGARRTRAVAGVAVERRARPRRYAGRAPSVACSSARTSSWRVRSAP